MRHGTSTLHMISKNNKIKYNTDNITKWYCSTWAWEIWKG